MTVNTPNVPKELKDMNIAELQQSFNDAVKQGDMQKAKVVMDEWNKKAETNNETLITENTDLKDVYKKLATFNNDENAEWQNEWGSDEEKKKRRQEFRKFILEDIQTYKSNLEKQHKNITDEKEKQINDLMNLLGAKDNEITSLTEKNKHLQERVLKLPNWKEIIPGAPGRRFNKLATQLKALVSTSGYPTNALILLFAQPEKNHIGLRRKIKKTVMGYGKEMGKVKKWLAKWSLDDVQKHLATIKNKVKTIANGTASNHEWTRDQATAIIQMINAIEADYRDYKISEVDNSLDRKNAKTWDNTNTHMHKWIDEKSTFNIAA